MAVVRRIRTDEGRRLRDLRLRALETDPDAFGSSYATEVDRPAGEWERRATAAAVGPRQGLFVAEVQAALAGMAGAYTPTAHPGTRHLYGMWVAPETRSNGIGAELVESVVGWCRQGGAEQVTLWVVLGNDGARGLYERAGFTETRESQPLPSNPSLIESRMSLRLDRATPPTRGPGSSP